MILIVRKYGGLNLDKIEFLSKVKLFKGLSKSQLEKFNKIILPVKFSANDVIIRENTMGDSMYILYSGKVMVSRTLTMKTGRDTFADKDKSLNVMDDSTFSSFGELGLIERTPRSATVTAIADCQLFEIKKGDFERLCGEDYELGYKLMRNMAEEVCGLLRKNSNDILKLTTALSIALSR